MTKAVRLTNLMIAATAFAALVSIGAYPTTDMVIRAQPDGTEVVDAVIHYPWGYVFATTMTIAAVLGTASLVTSLRRNTRMTRRLLLGTAIAALPALVPAALALWARHRVRQQPL